MKRSTDSAKISQAARGSLHIRTVNIVILVLAIVIFAILLMTIRSTARIVGQDLNLPGTDAARLARLLGMQELLTVLLLAVLLLTILSVIFLVLRPMENYISQIRENRELKMRGAYELRYLAEAYNLMYEENQKHQDTLRYRVEHDPLTGLLNRGAFDALRKEKEHDSIAMMLIDVDKFKEINDGYGHDVGDRVLQKVAEHLSQSFRASDYPCRIGGDEFAVIMTEMRPELRQAVLDKIETVKAGLRDTSDGLPLSTLSVGVAFSDQCPPDQDLFRLADTALYKVKAAGRDGCAFYDPEAESAT